MSGDCSSSATITPHVSASKPYFARVYPIAAIRSRTRRGMSTYVDVVISPATTTRPVVISVSPVRVVGEDRVENGVGDLVGDLVGVPLGDRLRREEEAAR